LKKKESKIETLYLYVHSFKWLKKSEAKHFRGHLKEGRVYKAEIEYLEEMDGKTLYKIDLLEDQASPSGIALLELSGKFDSWVCEIQVIDDEALLDLDITEEDMEMIALDESQFNIDTGEAREITSAEMVITEDEINDEFDVKNTTELIRELHNVDPEMVKFLMLLIKGTTGILKDEDYVTLTGHFSAKEGQVGRIANMVLTSAHLEAHLNSDSNDPANLMNAIFTILLELKRTVNIS
jgi:hypothetical protein